MFEDFRGVIRNRQSKKERQHNGKKGKGQKDKQEQEPHKPRQISSDAYEG
jgi:hypothetical protein